MLELLWVTIFYNFSILFLPLKAFDSSANKLVSSSGKRHSVIFLSKQITTSGNFSYNIRYFLFLLLIFRILFFFFFISFFISFLS